MPRFEFDLGSARDWIAAERHALSGVPVEWVPVRREESFRCAAEIDAYFEDVRRRAEAYELMAVRPPAGFPPETEFAMLAATYAKQIGKVVAFSLALFRQAFNAGRDLADRDTVFLAGAAAEIHPNALVKGAELRGTVERLRAATEQAAGLGVLDVPAVVVGDRVFHGDAELEAAAEALAGR